MKVSGLRLAAAIAGASLSGAPVGAAPADPHVPLGSPAPAEAGPAEAGDDRDIIYIHGVRELYSADDTNSLTRTPTPLEDIPQSVVVITRDVIRDQAMTGMGDLVRYVPGVTMGQGEGHRDAPVLRGSLTTSDFFIDGVRDDLQYLRDLYTAERVDVIKGASAVVFGRGTGGGAINRISKTADGGALSAVDVSLGSYGRGRLGVDVSWAGAPGAAYRLNAVLEESQSYRDEVEVVRRGLAPTLRVELSDNAKLDVFGELFSDERTVDRGVPSLNGRPWEGAAGAFFGNPDLSRSSADIATLRAVLSQDLTADLQLRATLSYGDYSKFYSNVFAGGAVSPLTGAVTISAYNAASDRQNLLGQADLVWNAGIAGLQHLILLGLEAGRQESANRRVNGPSQVFSLTDRGRTYAPDLSLAPAISNTNELNLFALLVQDQITLSDQLKAVLGLRWDSFDLAFDDRRPANADAARRDSFVSPKAGLIYQPADDLSLYAGWSLAFLPQSGEQFASLTPASAELRPEEFQNTEIGMRWKPSAGFLLSAALYRLDRTHTTAPGPVAGTLALTGSQRSQGLELALQGELAQGWNLIGALAVQEAEITSTTSAARAGTRAPLSAQFSASLWSRFRLTGGLDGALGIIHQSDQFASVSNAVTLPAYTRLDAALFFELTEMLDLQLNIENLTGTRYWASAHNDNNITPGSPLALRLGLSARY